MANVRKKIKKPHKYGVEEIITNLESGEAGVIGLKADMGDERAQAVIAQYTWYIKHPKDPKRIDLLQYTYGQYKKYESKLLPTNLLP